MINPYKIKLIFKRIECEKCSFLRELFLQVRFEFKNGDIYYGQSRKVEKGTPILVMWNNKIICKVKI